MPAENMTVSAEFTFSDGYGARLAGYSLSIQEDGDIGVRFYMSLSDDIANNTNAKMRFVLPVDSRVSSDIKTKIIDIPIGEADNAEIDGKSYYVFKCPIAAKEMTSEIKARIYVGDTVYGNEYKYTVKEYADYLIANAYNGDGTVKNQKYADALPLVKAMLCYGASAQKLFGNNTSDLADDGVNYTGDSADDIKTAVEAVIAQHTLTDLTKEQIGEGLTFSGTSLNLGSKTAYTLHYTLADGASPPAITSMTEGITVSMKKNGGEVRYYLKNISAGHLLDNIDIKIGEKQLTVNPASFMYAALETTEDEYVDLRSAVAALYNFDKEAKDYESKKGTEGQ